jgi:microcystin-dependent protein
MNAASITTTTTTTGTAINTGNSTAFSIMQPYTVVRCILAINGLYPSRP